MAPLRFESPVPALTGAWGRAIPLLSTRVTAAAAAWRRDGPPAEPETVTASCWMAHALLVAGEREPARDLAHLVARAVEQGRLRPAAASALPILLARLEGWTGDAAWTARYALALGLVRPAGAAGEPSPLGGLLDDAGATADAGDEAGRAAGLVHGVVYGMWGAVPDAVAGLLRLGPRLPNGWSGCALLGLRVGLSTLDLGIRLRPGALVLRVSRVHGPTVGILAEAPGAAVDGGALVDEQALGTTAVRFQAQGDHEVVWPISSG